MDTKLCLVSKSCAIRSGTKQLHHRNDQHPVRSAEGMKEVIEVTISIHTYGDLVGS